MIDERLTLCTAGSRLQLGLIMDDEVPWDVLMAAVRQIKTDNPSKTAKEVMEALVARGDAAELAAIKKMRNKVTSTLGAQKGGSAGVGVDAAALINKMLCDPHALANMSLLATGRDLKAVLEHVEEYEITFNCFTCKAALQSYQTSHDWHHQEYRCIFHI